MHKQSSLCWFRFLSYTWYFKKLVLVYTPFFYLKKNLCISAGNIINFTKVCNQYSAQISNQFLHRVLFILPIYPQKNLHDFMKISFEYHLYLFSLNFSFLFLFFFLYRQLSSFTNGVILVLPYNSQKNVPASSKEHVRHKGITQSASYILM